MRSDAALFNLEEGTSPVQNPSTAAEEARLASLISLDAILKQVKVVHNSIITSVYLIFDGLIKKNCLIHVGNNKTSLCPRFE